MPKVDFAMIVHNGEPFFSLNLKNIYPFANRIIIIEGPVGYYHKVLKCEQSNDGTLEAIANFPDPENKIVLEQGLWAEKDDMVRAQEKYFSGDFVWCPDADEFWKQDDIQKVFDYLDSHPECYSMSFRLLSFFGGFDRYIGGFEANFETHRIQRLSPGAHWITHRPPTLSWESTTKTCKEMGHVDGTKSLNVRIYHYSHLPVMRMKHKASYYKQLSSSIIPGYFEKVYAPWMAAKTDKERMVVENKFKGVQEFKPQCRTEAYTLPFTGNHPNVIESAKSQIKKQIELELKELKIR